MKPTPFALAALCIPLLATRAADLELSETIPLPEAHSVNWVRNLVKEHPEVVGNDWERLEDTAKHVSQISAPRGWVWNIPDTLWQDTVRQKGEGKREDVRFDLWIPEGVSRVQGVVVLSGHGSGESLYRREDLRQTARTLNLAVFKFLGNPMQRGFWPRSLLYERLRDFARKTQHPELEHAPLFLYGHSSAVGFSAMFAAGESHRVWGWVAMRAGYTFQIWQPAAAAAPGLVIFGEVDKYFANPHRDETLSIVPMMRKHHQATWTLAVEPQSGHGPGEKTWPLVLSFLKHSFAARVPADGDTTKAPAKLNALAPEKGWLGQNWSPNPGAYQSLNIAPFADFSGDKTTASWLINAAFASEWQAFHRE
ncbi:MAG: hypothetical protein RLZZ399_676 [Verrucomicrobiota bacterium]|jgi:hypothetical protein